VTLPLERFLLTYKGRLVEMRTEMNPYRIISLGISLAGAGADAAQARGPFRLGIEWIKAKSLDAERERLQPD
jgi:NADH dehydrogenase [ubiquinone] 1 alpha subcomplex assembly factor 1